MLVKKQRQGKTTLCSIRLALSPAAALLLKAKAMGSLPPDQKVLDAYLEKTPGQRAAVSGFVNYLRETYGVKVVLPRADTEKVRRKRLETEILAFMREGGEGEGFRWRWFSLALAYFHGVPKRTGKLVRSENIIHKDKEGVTVMLDGKNYWIPQPISLEEIISNRNLC